MSHTAYVSVVCIYASILKKKITRKDKRHISFTISRATKHALYNNKIFESMMTAILLYISKGSPLVEESVFVVVFPTNECVFFPIVSIYGFQHVDNIIIK